MSWLVYVDFIFKGIVIAGGVYLFYFMKNMYDREIANYKARIDVLKETQVEKYVERMNKFKELYESTINEREKEIENLKQEMDNLLKKHLSKDEIIQSQKKIIHEFESRISHHALELWDQFMDDSERILKIEHPDKWDDIIAKRGGIVWSIKINDKLRKRLSRRPLKDNIEK